MSEGKGREGRERGTHPTEPVNSAIARIIKVVPRRPMTTIMARLLRRVTTLLCVFIFILRGWVGLVWICGVVWGRLRTIG